MKFSVKPLPNQVAQIMAQRARALRKAEGWSQAELADRSGVSLGSVKRFEQQGKISFNHLLALAHVLGRLSDFDQVFYRDDWALRMEQRLRKLNGYE